MNIYLTTVSALAILACVEPALAQTGPAPEPQQAAAPPTSGLEVVVITATRRSEDLQKAAVSVTALSSDELEARGITNVVELTKLVPAVKIGTTSGSGIQVTVRGVGNFGGNVFAEPGVAVNLDGVYLARAPSASGTFYDVDRVEVLKGPQGTLYGRNSTGGVVNVLTNDPTSDFGGALTVEAGNYDLKRLSAAVNIPLSDTLALRVAGQGIDRDGYMSDGYNDDKGYAGRVKLKWEPTDQFSLVLAADYAKTEGKGSTGVFVPYIDGGDPYLGPSTPQSNAVFATAPLPPPVIAALPRITSDGFLDNEAYGVQATANYDFGFATATVIAAHREIAAHYLHYGAGFPVTDDSQDDPSKTDSVEFRLSSNDEGKLKWVAGAFYFDDVFHTRVSPDQGTTFAQPNVYGSTVSWSAFGEATYSLTDEFRLTAGGRWTSDDKDISGTQTAAVLAPPAAYAVVCPAAAGAILIPGPTRNPSNTATFGATCEAPVAGQKTFEKFTWKVGAEADLSDQSLLFATVATGFKAGGFYASLNTAPAGSNPNNSYEPEELTAYTIGSKNRFFANSLQLNLEGFFWDYKDKQVPHIGIVQPGNNINLIVENAAGAEIYGVELGGLWEPISQGVVSFDVQYLHAQYQDFQYGVVVPAFAQNPAAQPATSCPFAPITSLAGPGTPGVTRVDCSGRTIPFSPEWVFNLGYRHTFDLASGSTIVAGLSTHIESEFQIGEEYLPGQTQDASMVSDFDLTWNSSDEAYSITAYVQNIEDEAVAQTGFVQPTLGRPLNILRPPRTYGARLNVRF